MPLRPLPSQARLLSLLRFDPQTGHLFWLPRPDNNAWSARFAGCRAGTVDARGRRSVTIECVRYFESRVIYMILHGVEPPMVDHRDRDFTNNLPSNLRAASRSQNAANSKHRARPVHDLPRGVFASSSLSNPYRARCGSQHLGMFATVDDAADAVRRAHKEHFGEFSNV